MSRTKFHGPKDDRIKSSSVVGKREWIYLKDFVSIMQVCKQEVLPGGSPIQRKMDYNQFSLMEQSPSLKCTRIWKAGLRSVKRSLSRIPRDSLKHFEISVPQNIRVAEVRKTINRTTTLPNEYVIWFLKFNNVEKLLFSTIFCYLFLDFHVKTGTRISLRDKRLFEISEVEITRVDCSFTFSL